MSATEDKAVAALVAEIQKRALKQKGKPVEEITQATRLLLIWISHLRTIISNSAAEHLLNGVQGAIIEVAGCLALGLVRPAIFALRVQLELTLAWIYFNDHAVEFAQIENDAHEFPLRAKLKGYMQEYGGRFSKRLTILSENRTRKIEDPYGILSNYVHSHSELSSPKVRPLQEIVESDARCAECVELQKEVAEYLTDTLAAWFADSWHDWPQTIKDGLSSRLTAKKLKDFSKKHDILPAK